MYAKDTPGSAPQVTTSKRPAPPTETGNLRPGKSATRDLPRVDVVHDQGLYLRFGKRFLDVVVSAALLLLLSPLLLTIALLIRIDSRGPVLYRCMRVGKAGRVFTFLKFRSMVRDARDSKSALMHLNEVDGPVFKLSNDPRITRVGRFLRRSSLDELPQLFHVLRGEMTLVGPRPPEPEEVWQYEPWQLRRLAVRPGLTCLWQVSGRSLVPFEEWMRLDLQYIETRSFALDVWILLKTIPAVLSGKGAY